MILAKSDPQIDLKTHINDCINILKSLEICIPKLKIFDLEFFQTLKLAIVIHDLGKIHPEFQKYIRGNDNIWKFQRHEIYSSLFISSFSQIEYKTKLILHFTVLCHHKDLTFLQKHLYRNNTTDEINLLLDSNLKSSYINFPNDIEKKIASKILIDFGYELSQLNSESPKDVIKKFLNEKNSINTKTGLLYTLFLGALKQCDHLGSAQINNIPELKSENFSFLDKYISTLKNHNKHLFHHQIISSESNDNVLLIAPTGSGKTESSMLWLKNQLKNTNSFGRVFYILPYIASINAMYERLSGLFESKKIVGMIHGNLTEYLNQYFSSKNYSIEEINIEINTLKEKFKQISTPIKVCTPFQILKHLFGLKHFEKGIVEMVGAYFIFDEIHSYDPRITAQILVLLNFITDRLHGKVFIMSATIPTFLKELINENISQKINIIYPDNQTLNEFNRHRVILKNGLIDNSLKFIKKLLSKRSKILIVCNTVNKSQKIFRDINDLNLNSLLIHSRFTGKDRIEIEKNIKDGNINILIGTQAIEVSLDLDYDILISELAPLDALLQRFGRVNRKREKGISDCYIFSESDKNSKKIYGLEILEKTLDALKKIEKKDEGIIHENRIQIYIDEVYPNWTQSQENEFDTSFNLFKNRLNNIFPAVYSESSEEDFYKQFDGIKILPVEFEEDYLKFLNELDFINAESLKVPISSKLFFAWISDQNKNLIKKTFLYEKKDEMKSISYFVTNKKYDCKLGLLNDQEVSWNTSINDQFL